MRLQLNISKNKDDMKFKFFTLVIFLCLGTSQWAMAQAMAVKPEANFSNQIVQSASLGVTTETPANEDWTLYADEENKLYYIDFENLKVNLSDIVVKNANGEVLLKDNVFDLPVNTIYELDFSAYRPGIYEIELRSFTNVIRKKLVLK